MCSDVLAGAAAALALVIGCCCHCRCGGAAAGVQTFVEHFGWVWVILALLVRFGRIGAAPHLLQSMVVSAQWRRVAARLLLARAGAGAAAGLRLILGQPLLQMVAFLQL